MEQEFTTLLTQITKMMAMRKSLLLPMAFLFVSTYALSQSVEFYGTPTAIISSGAIIPKGSKMLWTSGALAAIVDSTAREGSAERFGNTKAQATNILENF